MKRRSLFCEGTGAFCRSAALGRAEMKAEASVESIL